ncbi:hypothetical protein [Brevundimonas sp. Leaf363]|uniref:hypothetical protein n=1 Tax=Brevundimonas sp. Leaf363 TaxID=1736353 RepID=UPI0012E22544|nr:hypothetical protein [Brevundimonas sp. Leaf363]
MSERLSARLTKPRIQLKPKPVTTWAGWFDTAGVSADPKLRNDLLDLIDLITEGKPIPNRYYRSSAGRDRLLEEEGIMHLHLGHAGSNVIIYLLQFEDEVLLLAAGTHAELQQAYQVTWRKQVGSTPADQRAKGAAALRAKQAAKAAEIKNKARTLAIEKLKKSSSPTKSTPVKAPPDSD